MNLCLHGDFIYCQAALPTSSKRLTTKYTALRDFIIHIITIKLIPTSHHKQQ